MTAQDRHQEAFEIVDGILHDSTVNNASDVDLLVLIEAVLGHHSGSNRLSSRALKAVYAGIAACAIQHFLDVQRIERDIQPILFRIVAEQSPENGA